MGELFDAHRHKTIATIRADGSPRISGIESQFENGELVFSSMPFARKGADLRRDGRFALHSATVDPVEGDEAQWPGEAKIAGRAILDQPSAPAMDGERFRADITEVDAASVASRQQAGRPWRSPFERGRARRQGDAVTEHIPDPAPDESVADLGDTVSDAVEVGATDLEPLTGIDALDQDSDDASDDPVRSRDGQHGSG